MRTIALFATGCGASAYFPQEPPLPDTALPTVDTAGEPIEQLPCTGYGAFAVEMTIHNRGEAPLDMYYRDVLCNELLYARLDPGVTAYQSTWELQAWVVRDPTGEAAASILVDEPYELWEVP